jgi:hypothetical protein
VNSTAPIVAGKTSTPQRSGAAQTLLLAQAFSLVVVVLVAGASRSLRPISDDYCIAIRGEKGILGGVNEWWQTWSGDLFATFAVNISVGIPLATLPLSLSSSLPFLLAGFIVAIAVLFATRLALRNDSRSGWWLLMQSPFIMILWWAYLWVPNSPQSSTPSSIALGLTHWQTLNGIYLIPASALLILITITYRITSRWSRTGQFVSLIVGILFGLSGPVLGLALFIAAAATSAFAVIWRATLPKRFVNNLVLLGAGALIGLAIAMASPGARIRRDYVNPNTEVSPRRLLEILDFVFPTALVNWIDAFLHWGTLVVLLATGATAWLAVKIGFGWSSSLLAKMVVTAVTFTLILSIANRTTEAFVYDAYWHQSSIRFFAFASSVLAGVLLGQYLGSKESQILPPTIVVVLATCLLASLGAVFAMSNSIYEREEVWRAGPAPIPGVAADIEDPEIWVYNCWLGLKEIRDMPDRG